MNQKLETFQKNIKRLAELAAAWEPSSRTEACGTPKVFEVENGKALVWVLHERESVSIVKSYLTPGATFPTHIHEVKEVIILFEGSATYESVDVIRELLPGSCVSVAGGKPHKITAGDEGAWFSITTVPREEGFSR